MRQRFFCGSGRSDGLLSDLPGVEGFFAGEAQAEKADGDNEKKAGFDEEFSAAGPMDGGILQGGIGEEAVPEERGGGEINREVERLPEMAA